MEKVKKLIKVLTLGVLIVGLSYGAFICFMWVMTGPVEPGVESVRFDFKDDAWEPSKRVTP